MKILIVGKNSYIGNHIDQWLSARGFKVEQLDVLNNRWENYDYSSFNAIVHVAGIVHQPNCQDWELYKRVNTDMPISIAKIAKSQGVKQFVFLSSMGVYGIGKKLSPNIIDKNTPLSAESMYGKSKLMAEKGLMELQDDNFNVVCVRPPSVYGKGCKGGYIKGFQSIAKYLPIIPKAYENVKQSFVYIDNLSEFVRLAIEKNIRGSFCIQDEKSVCANELLKVIKQNMGKKNLISSFMGIFVFLLSFIPIVKKVYGGVEYSKALTTIKDLKYVVVPFEEGMRRTISKNV